MVVVVVIAAIVVVVNCYCYHCWLSLLVLLAAVVVVVGFVCCCSIFIDARYQWVTVLLKPHRRNSLFSNPHMLELHLSSGTGAAEHQSYVCSISI